MYIFRNPEVLMARRSFLRQMAALPLASMMSWGQGTTRRSKASLRFLHGLAVSEAGHAAQIFLLGEAVSLMRRSVASAVVPVGWPPLDGTLTKLVGRHVPITPAVLVAGLVR